MANTPTQRDMKQVARRLIKRMNISHGTKQAAYELIESINFLPYVHHGKKRTGLIAFILYAAVNSSESMPTEVTADALNPLNLLEVAKVDSLRELNTLFQYWSSQLGVDISTSPESYIAIIGNRLELSSDTIGELIMTCRYVLSIDTEYFIVNLGPLSCAAAVIAYWGRKCRAFTTKEVAAVAGIANSTVVVNVRKVKRILEV